MKNNENYKFFVRKMAARLISIISIYKMTFKEKKKILKNNKFLGNKQLIFENIYSMIKAIRGGVGERVTVRGKYAQLQN